MVASACKCDGACAGGCKPARKTLAEGETPVGESGMPMYTSGDGVDFSLSIIVGRLTASARRYIGTFTCSEDEDGMLVIHTGMQRVGVRQLALPVASSCAQPCSGDCESCPVK